MKTTDAWGRTRERAVESARRVAALHPGKELVLGRLYMSPRRWLWGERFGDKVARELDTGERWEPVEVVTAG
jgi:hypothetical protein